MGVGLENLPQVVDCWGRGVVRASTGQGSGGKVHLGGKVGSGGKVDLGGKVGARESLWLASNAHWWEEEEREKEMWMRTHWRVPIDWRGERGKG